MSTEQRRGPKLWFYGASLLIHGAIAGFTVIAPAPERPEEPIAITLAELSLEVPEPEEEPAPIPEPEPEPEPEIPAPAPEPPPPPPPEPNPEPPQPPPEPAAPAPPSQEAAPPEPAGETPAFADLGLVMGGGGPGGVAVASAQPMRPRAPKARPAQAAAAKPAVPRCTEEPTRARPKKVVPPSYTTEAQQAEIEGPIRMEIAIDAEGRVTAAKVLRGLGYGLDEAAVAAAKEMLFEPARRCGKAVPSTLTFNMRFTLDS